MTERFLILCQVKGEAAENLQRVLAPLGEVVIVEDVGAVRPGFTHLGTFFPEDPAVCAWDMAFGIVDPTIQTWFISDRVAGSLAYFTQLVAATPPVDLACYGATPGVSDHHCARWCLFEGLRKPWHSDNTLCRLSPDLLVRVLKFRECYNRFVFHEVLFASLARGVHDWATHCPRLFGSFHNGADVMPQSGAIHHPVSDPAWHFAACHKLA